MPDTLAQKVRAKYPGVYDDLNDQVLEAKVIAKYPGVYDDIPKTQTAAKVESAPPPAQDGGMLETAKDLAIGAGKGVVNTISGLGTIARKVPGVSALDKIMTPIEVNTTPANTTQAIGKGVEQVAEFFAPTGLVGKAGKAAEVAKAGALTLAQSGSPTAAGLSAGLTAVLPGAGAAKKAASALETSAQKSMAQALGATKEWAKAEATKLAPQMLKRGVGGSRQAMLETAKVTAKRVGGQLDDAYRLAAEAGEAVPSNIIAGNVQLAKDALQITNTAGKRMTIPGTEGVVQKLDDLSEFVLSMGDDIPVDKAAHIKRTWDQIVSKAGLFGPKATASATDNANAWAIREASNSFRELLNTNPTIAALNKESAFWTGLKNVLRETEKRTQAQSGGLVRAGMGGTGAVIGAMQGDSASDAALKGVIGGIAGRQLIAVVQSPAFRTKVSGPLKQALAEALASGSQGRIASVTSRIAASLPAQLTPSLAR